MAEIPSSSFIPRQNQSAVPTRIRRRRTFSIFSFISTTLLLGSLILSGGAYLYKSRVEAHLADVKAELTAQEGLFNDASIHSVQIFDRKIRAAKHLLQNHIAPSKIFTALEKTTMDRIQYVGLDFTYDPGFEAEINVIGGTEEFKTVALQALAYGNEALDTSALFKNAIFSEIGTAETASVDSDSESGNESKAHAVNFSIIGIVAPALLQYDGVYAPVSAYEVPSQDMVSALSEPTSEVINQNTL